jgi:hypothetical protein
MYLPKKLMQANCFSRTFLRKGVTGYAVKTNDFQTKIKEYILKISKVKIIYNANITNITQNEIDYSTPPIPPTIESTKKSIDFDTLFVCSGNINKIPSLSSLGFNSFMNHIPHLYGLQMSIDITNDILKDTIKAKREKDTDFNDGKFNKSKEQNRFRFFIQNDGNIYLGINLMESEYKDIESHRETIFPRDTNITLTKSIHERYIKLISGFTNISEDDFYQIDAATGNKTDESYLQIKKNNVQCFPIEMNYVEPGSKQFDNSVIYIVGDAAVQGHFFTAFGINFGLASVQKLSQSIANNNSSKEIEDYNQFINKTQKLTQELKKFVLIYHQNIHLIL